MDVLKFNIKKGLGVNRNKYQVYIDRDTTHYFNSKTAADRFIRKYRATITDNVVMLNALFNQVETLNTLYYPSMNNKYKVRMLSHLTDFKEQYNFIYVGGSTGFNTAVQFNKINLCFRLFASIVKDLKAFAQLNKHSVLLFHLKGIYKLFLLIESSYNSDIKFLFVPHALKGHIKLKINNETEINTNTTRTSNAN